MYDPSIRNALVADRVKFLETVLEVDPKNDAAAIELAWIHADHFHSTEEGLRILYSVLDRNPESVDAAFWLAKIHYHSASDPQLVSDILKGALEKDPGNPACASLYGSVCGDLENPNLALSHLDLALQREPSWVGLLEGLDSIFSQLDQHEQSVALARRAYALAKKFFALSNEQNYTYYECVVTGRWVSKHGIDRMEMRAARRKWET